METNRQQFILQQLSLTASTAYAMYAPDETTLQQHIAADYWAKQLAAEEQRTWFVTIWRAGYHFQQTVQHAALTYTQTRNRTELSSTFTGAMQQLQDQLGGDAGEARALFNAQKLSLQPRDEQQARQIESLVQHCRHFFKDSWSVWGFFQKHGTWRQLITWAVLGLDEALSQLAPDHAMQVTATQLSASSGISEPLCSWHLDARLNPEERAQAVKDAIAELTARWGYRDVTELIRQMNATYTAEHPEEGREKSSYLCVLQTLKAGQYTAAHPEDCSRNSRRPVTGTRHMSAVRP